MRVVFDAGVVFSGAEWRGEALQEADESALWLELLREDCGIAPDTLPMEKEANELMAIMTTMINRTKDKS
jgi:hypothetical protein